MRHEIRFSGFGGQGIILSAVIIDDDPILYPKVSIPGIYVIMSQEGFEKYGAGAQEDAVMLVDSTLVHSRPKCRCIEIPATREAKQNLKKDIVANIVMLGALVAATHVVSEESLKKAILDSVPKGTEDLNLKAMQLGLQLGKQP